MRISMRYECEYPSLFAVPVPYNYSLVQIPLNTFVIQQIPLITLPLPQLNDKFKCFSPRAESRYNHTEDAQILFPKLQEMSEKEIEDNFIHSESPQNFFFSDHKSEKKNNCSESCNSEIEKDEEIELKILQKSLQLNKNDVGRNRKQLESKLEKLDKSKDESCNDPILFESKCCKSRSESRITGRNSEKQYRGSQFRGVSKNGKRFQIFIMINKKKQYYGVMNSAENAARVYDKLAIIFHGIRAKTNFSYKTSEVYEILKFADQLCRHDN